VGFFRCFLCYQLLAINLFSPLFPLPTFIGCLGEEKNFSQPFLRFPEHAPPSNLQPGEPSPAQVCWPMRFRSPSAFYAPHTLLTFPRSFVRPTHPTSHLSRLGGSLRRPLSPSYVCICPSPPTSIPPAPGRFPFLGSHDSCFCLFFLSAFPFFSLSFFFFFLFRLGSL